MTMKEVSVVIICLLLISVVRGEDVTCKPGEGVFDYKFITSGPASQCSGLSKITTEAECKFAQEDNKKNEIDENKGFGGRVKWSNSPPGCFYRSDFDSDFDKYYFNDIALKTDGSFYASHMYERTITMEEWLMNSLFKSISGSFRNKRY